MSGKTIIEMHDIIKTYYLGTPNELEILHGINLNVYDGEFVSIVGASGSGKSTLMNLIGALDRPRIPAGRRFDPRHAEQSAFRHPQPQDRLCVPDL